MTQSTIDHQSIRNWIERYGGIPAMKQSTSYPQLSLGVIFPDQTEDDGFTPITWDEFFEIFDSVPLVFVYDEETGSQFIDFVHPARLNYA